MKVQIKKMFYTIFGVKENIFFKLTLSFLVISIIFILFMINSPENSKEFIFFMYASDISFALWLIMAKGTDSAKKIVTEFMRLAIFLGSFMLSIYFFCFFSFYDGMQLIIFTILACIGLFMSVFYFISLFITMFNFAKNIFEQIKSKLFNSTHCIEKKTTSITAFIENISAFLVAIGGFCLTIKGIIEPAVKIVYNYFYLLR